LADPTQSEHENQRSRWLGPTFVAAMVSLAVTALGNAAAFFWVTVPQAAIQSELDKQRAAIAENEAKNRRQPRLRLLPTVSQSVSVEDIREIRLELLIENIGQTGESVDSITVKALNGHLEDDAAETVFRTQRAYRKMLELAYRRRLVDQVAYEEQLGEVQIEENCPHGRLFAIADGSPSLEWKEVARARQVSDARKSLGPGETVSESFVFLLTEYPEQHNRQWLRFEIEVERGGPSSGRNKTDTFSVLVSGLPMPTAFSGRTPTPVYENSTTSAPSNEAEVWRPQGPLQPTN